MHTYQSMDALELCCFRWALCHLKYDDRWAQKWALAMVSRIALAPSTDTNGCHSSTPVEKSEALLSSVAELTTASASARCASASASADDSTIPIAGTDLCKS
jgi:hypothetical protein